MGDGAARGVARSRDLASAGAALLALVAPLLAGCGDGSPAPPPAGSLASPLPPAPPARRPSRRAYLARAPARCEIYAEDGEDRTEPLATPCPEYLLIGERIRLAGKACFLENKAQPEREKPVVCPDPLTRFEQRAREEKKKREEEKKREGEGK